MPQHSCAPQCKIKDVLCRDFRVRAGRAGVAWMLPPAHSPSRLPRPPVHLAHLQLHYSCYLFLISSSIIPMSFFRPVSSTNPSPFWVQRRKSPDGIPTSEYPQPHPLTLFSPLNQNHLLGMDQLPIHKHFKLPCCLGSSFLLLARECCGGGGGGRMRGSPEPSASGNTDHSPRAPAHCWQGNVAGRGG